MRQLAAHMDAVQAARLAAARQKQQQLQQRLLRVMHLLEVRGSLPLGGRKGEEGSRAGECRQW